MESISFALFHTNAFIRICEMIWWAFNPENRSIVNPSGFTGQAIKLLLYLLQSKYFTNIALNPLYFDFFQLLLSDFETLYQFIQTPLIQHEQELNNYQYNKSKDDEEEIMPIIPTFMQTLSDDLQSIVGLIQPVVKLREQGFKSSMKVFASLLRYEKPVTGGDYDFDLEFFHLRFPANHTIDIENKTNLYALNAILKLFIDTASCPAIIELLCQESFINMIPIILRTFIKFFNDEDRAPELEDTWYFPSDSMGLTNENDLNSKWVDRSPLIMELLANTLKLTYIYLNELYASNSFRYPYKIVPKLFDIQRVLASRVWQHDVQSFTRNNHYYTHITDHECMSSHSFVDCSLEFKNQHQDESAPSNPHLQTIYESLAGIFAFTLCPPPPPPNPFMMNQHVTITPDGIDDTILYPEKFEIEEFLESLAFEPQLFYTNLTTLHQTLIHVNALGLKQHWIKRLSSVTAQRKLLVCMKNLALSADFYVHQILPCVYIQLSQLDIKIAQTILNPFIEMLFAQFLPQHLSETDRQQVLQTNPPTSNWQLIRLCKCLSWMLRDSWCVSLTAPKLLKQYLSDTNFVHKVDKTSLQHLLQQVQIECEKQAQTANTNPNPPTQPQNLRRQPSSSSMRSDRSRDRERSSHRSKNHNRNSHSRGRSHHKSSKHRDRENEKSSSHSRSRSRHNRRKHKHKHRDRDKSSKVVTESNNNVKEAKKVNVMVKKVDRSEYYLDTNCWVLDPRIVRILYLKTPGLLNNLFKYISQTDAGLVVAVVDILQSALTYIPSSMSDMEISELLPSANDIGIILSHLHSVLEAAQFTSTQTTIINEFQWRFWMCCFTLYGRIASLPSINIKLVIRYFPLELIKTISGSALGFLRSYANTKLAGSHNFNLHVSEKLQCLIIITWFISMICKHINNINRIKKKHVDTTLIQWEDLYKTQFQQVIDVLNKLNEVGFNHIVTEIQYCQRIFAQNDTFKSKEDRDDDGNEDVDIDIVLDNDAVKNQPKSQIPANQVTLENNHNIKDKILLNTQSTATVDQLVSKMYANPRFNKHLNATKNKKSKMPIQFIDSLWYTKFTESTINWWHLNQLSVIRLCSYSTNYDFSASPPKIYDEKLQANPSMFNAIPIPQASTPPVTQQLDTHHLHHRVHHHRPKVAPRTQGTDRFRSNNYTGGRAPSIHVDDFQNDPNMVTMHTPTTAKMNVDNHTNNHNGHQPSTTNHNNNPATIHVPVPTASTQQYRNPILLPSTGQQTQNKSVTSHSNNNNMTNSNNNVPPPPHPQHPPLHSQPSQLPPPHSAHSHHPHPSSRPPQSVQQTQHRHYQHSDRAQQHNQHNHNRHNNTGSGHPHHPQMHGHTAVGGPRIIQSTINPMGGLAATAALIQRQSQINQIAAAQQQINQMNQINMIRNAAAQQQQQQAQINSHLLRR